MIYFFVWTSCLKKDHPHRPYDSKPQMYLEGALSFLKLSRWDANDCSPGNNPLRGTDSRKMLSSYPKKPASQLSKQARRTYHKGGNSGNRWGETEFNPSVQGSESRITSVRLTALSLRAGWEQRRSRNRVYSESTAKHPSAQRGTITVLLLCHSWHAANIRLSSLCTSLSLAYHAP